MRLASGWRDWSFSRIEGFSEVVIKEEAVKGLIAGVVLITVTLLPFHPPPAGIHWAVCVWFAAGILDGRAGDQPVKVYHSFVGSAGGVIVAPKSSMIASTRVPPSELKVKENCPLLVQSAIYVWSHAGIVRGSAGDQPAKVYPSFVGSSGDVITAPKSSVIGLIALPPSVSKVIV